MPAAFIARQPIFNPQLEVVGYELLFRGQGYAADALVDDPRRATATVVLNSFTELELERIVGHKRAWVNLSRDFVLDGLVQAIPPKLGGLEIAEDELFDDELVAALSDLKGQGYRLALDDFRGRPGSDSVVGLFDVVKLNMPALGPEGVSEQIARLRHHGNLLLGDKLATRPDHDWCAAAGCDLFQGFFFCQPAVVGTRGIAANRLALLQVVAALQDPTVDLDKVEQLIVRDVALSFRMLRYVNSAFFGLRGEVRSIGQALALLGAENVRRWATLSVLASVDDKPTELTVTALIRARFCELAADQLRIAGPGELFTLGLFSVIDGMMDAPMGDVLESLPLADDMRDALIHRSGPMGQLLECVTALEAGDYAAASMLARTDELYLTAVIWANTAAESLFAAAGPGVPASGAPTPEPSGPAPAIAAAPAHDIDGPGPDAGAPPSPGPLRRFAARVAGLLRRRPRD